mmetsp:Transcript_21805/g.43265  ORF Transcript_21805/g.43265 Transcript_21805/m.43265 type:complete len:237 (+) Transcript_21805:68-778(+)
MGHKEAIAVVTVFVVVFLLFCCYRKRWCCWNPQCPCNKGKFHYQEVDMATFELEDDGLSAFTIDDYEPPPKQTSASGKHSSSKAQEENKQLQLNSLQGFQVKRCLSYTRQFLEQWTQANPQQPSEDADLDVEEFMGELEVRWRLIDEAARGQVTVNDLRLAVWDNEPSNTGTPMPPVLPEGLQLIVDDIIGGVGLDGRNLNATFTFWDFVNYLLKEADGVNYNIVIASPPEAWAHL